ncbi:MAG: hypothetical protein LBT56_00305 [Prevotellaceae bacterium]|jgi:hypothetical protein|nr:hypothetical protein [Prevotellaceae bacterium]
MKKVIFTAILALSVLGFTSCNKDVEPIEFTPQATLAINVSDLMMYGLANVFGYVELISAKIAKGETIDESIVVESDGSGWSTEFADNQTFKGKISVLFNGSPLDDGAKKQVDCSETKLRIPNSNTEIPLFGEFDITNISTSSSETSRSVITNQFGWGDATNNAYIDAVYEFNTNILSTGEISECKISGYATGNHVQYGHFSQTIITDLNVGYVFFKSGSMVLSAASIGAGLPIEVYFNSAGMYGITIQFNGEQPISY